MQLIDIQDIHNALLPFSSQMRERRKGKKRAHVSEERSNFEVIHTFRDGTAGVGYKTDDGLRAT
jgi:hypothetical protein